MVLLNGWPLSSQLSQTDLPVLRINCDAKVNGLEMAYIGNLKALANHLTACNVDKVIGRRNQ